MTDGNRAKKKDDLLTSVFCGNMGLVINTGWNDQIRDWSK